MATKLAHLRSAQALAAWPGSSSGATLRRPAVERRSGYCLAKRVFDVALASLLLVLLAPLMALIALAVVLDSPGPAFFVQQRVRGDQFPGSRHPERNTFRFLKFRTMTHRADPAIHQEYMRRLINGEAEKSGDLFKLAHDPRVTRVGRWLRKTSLDELPQLINILRGEMTFVGPRPAIPYELAHYKPEYMERFTVTQGLTGLWQVMGRNELSFDEMMALDARYARTRSFLGDLHILLSTIPVVLIGRGVC